jgi:uncharacterized protein (TIGR04255 family)
MLSGATTALPPARGAGRRRGFVEINNAARLAAFGALVATRAKCYTLPTPLGHDDAVLLSLPSHIMLEHIRYNKPPLVEVVCEFRFAPGKTIATTLADEVYEKLKAQFAKRRILGTLSTEVAAGADGFHQQIKLTERTQFLRTDEKCFVQLEPNFLAINHLPPYPTWEGYRPLIYEAYQAYLDVAQPASLNRIGLRYINRLTFPGKQIQFETYLNLYPFAGPDLPQMLFAVDMRVHTAFEDDRDFLSMRLNFPGPTTDEKLTALLDFDYFSVSQQSVDPDKVYGWLEQAHLHIQEAFEASVTAELKPSFEPLEP